MTVLTQDLQMYRGAHVAYTFLVTNESGVVVDLTSATIRFTVRSAVPDGSVSDDTSAVFTKTVGSGITVAAPTSGSFEVDIPKTNTSTLSITAPTYYYYGLEYIPSGQTDPITLAQGRLLIIPDIARA